MSSPVSKIIIVAIALVGVDIAYARMQTPKGATSKPAVASKPREVGGNVVIDGRNGPLYFYAGRLTRPGGSITNERVTIPRSQIDILAVYEMKPVLLCEKGKACFEPPCIPPYDESCPVPPPPPPPPWPPVLSGNDLMGIVGAPATTLKK